MQVSECGPLGELEAARKVAEQAQQLAVERGQARDRLALAAEELRTRVKDPARKQVRRSKKEQER